MLWQPLNVESWVSMRRGSLADVKESVEAIIEDVRKNGDAALFALTEKFDKQKLSSLRISREAIDEAYDAVDPALVQALIEADARITRFHELQMDKSLWLEETEPGITLGVKTTPLDRVGAYIPGGRAAYPSTVLMTTVAARVAGVPEIVLYAAAGTSADPCRSRHCRRYGGLLYRRGTGHCGSGSRNGNDPTGPEDRRAGERVRHSGKDAVARTC